MLSLDSERSGRSGSRTPGHEHNWRATVIHGGVLWLLVGLAGALPLGEPFGFGVAVVAVLVVPVLPVALCCDYQQTRAVAACEPGVAAYARHLGRDLLTTLRRQEPLGSDRYPDGC